MPPREPSPPYRMRPVERSLVWLYTGPLGHLYGTLADVTQLWLAYSRERIARRLRHGDAGLAP